MLPDNVRISVLAPTSEAVALVAARRAQRESELFNEVCQIAWDLGIVVSCTPSELYDLELHGCLFDFASGAFDITAIYERKTI